MNSFASPQTLTALPFSLARRTISIRGCSMPFSNNAFTRRVALQKKAWRRCLVRDAATFVAC